jgi:hypothetical protein
VSNCDYTISSKATYLDDTREFGVDKFNKPRSLKNRGYKSACQTSLMVYDLRTEEEVFNLYCLGTFFAHAEEEGKLNIYQTSKSASATVVKKNIKNIK